jgi:hypothetical protein
LRGSGGLPGGVRAPQASARKKKVEILKKWSGSAENETVARPECITTARDLQTVWKAFKIKGEAPKLDFTKNMVVAVYSVGSRLNLAGASLDEKGNLSVLGFGTQDIRPGFRFVLAVVSRNGVKTVNNKPLPKE